MIKKIILSIVLLFTILLFGSGWYFSSQILHLPISQCKPERYVFCGEPSEQNIAFENVSFTSIDGYKLPGWYMKTPKGISQKAILLVHGRGANRTEGMRYAKSLLNAGYNVLAFDMRHPRQNPDIISTMGYHEQKDVIAALDFLEKQGNATLGVMGFSMGASTSIIVMSKDKRIKAGVFSGGYANAIDELAEQAKVLYGLPRYPLMPIVAQLFSWRGNVDLSDINPETVIGSISPRAVYIMHGTADATVNFHHAERLFKAAKQPKLLWRAENGKHTELWQLNKQKAEQSVVGFFNQYL